MPISSKISKQFKFTIATLDNLPSNPKDSRSTELEFSDTEVTGLKCLVGKTGNKRFLLRYTFEGRKQSISIGQFPEVDISTARKVARDYKNQLAKGVNPKDVRDGKKRDTNSK